MMKTMPVTEPVAIVILGASGDLTARKLVPALHSLGCEGALHPATRVIGVARTLPLPTRPSAIICMRAWSRMRA